MSSYRKASVQRLIAACRLLLSPDAPERDDPFGTDFTQDDAALAAMRGALDELDGQVAYQPAAPSDDGARQPQDDHRQGCVCACCDHSEGSDCGCECHSEDKCSFQPAAASDDGAE